MTNRYLLTVIAITSTILAVCIWFCGALEISHAGVTLIDSPDQKQTYVTLPFSKPGEADRTLFTVYSLITYNGISSGHLRITPPYCIKAIRINEKDVFEVREVPEWRRCTPNTYTIDLSRSLRSGANLLEIDLSDGNNQATPTLDMARLFSKPAMWWECCYPRSFNTELPSHLQPWVSPLWIDLTNKANHFGIVMVGPLSQPAMLAFVAFAGLGLFAGAFALLRTFAERLRVSGSGISRWFTTFILSCPMLFAKFMAIAKKRLRRIRQRYLLTALAFAILAACVWFLGTLEISHVRVELVDSPDHNRTYVTLPFSTPREADKSLFRASATIYYDGMSSRLLRITPNYCIKAIRLNDKTVPEVKNVPERWRCHPKSYTIDLSRYLRFGANSLHIELSDRPPPPNPIIDMARLFSKPAVWWECCYPRQPKKEFPPHSQLGAPPLRINVTKSHIYGIVMVAPHAESTVLACVALAGLALYAGAFALLGAFPEFNSGIGRLCRMSFLPCLGLVAICATIANNNGYNWPNDPIVPILVATIVSLALLLRVFDKSGGKPLKLSRSCPAAAASLMIVAYASILLAQRGLSNLEIDEMAVVGVIAGFFALIPFRPFVEHLRHDHRAVAVAIVAALCPNTYLALNLWAWSHLSGVTNAMIRGALWVCGFATTIYTTEEKGGDGKLTDFNVHIASSDFSVHIGSLCSGFEGVFMFVFLLSVFVLLDWRLFSKVTRLWVAYLLTIPFILIINVSRISGLFLYAEWYIWWYKGNGVGRATMEAFHSNIGWMLYFVAFTAFLPLLYRWAMRAGKVKQ